MIPTVGIIPVSLHFLRWDQNVSPVLPAPCIEPAILVPDLGRVAVGAIATAERRIVRHMPGRVEFFVQHLVLGWVLAMNDTVSRLLRLDCRSGAEENHRREELA